MNTRMGKAAMLMMMAVAAFENGGWEQDVEQEPKPAAPKMVKLKPGQKIFKVENGDVVECASETYHKNDENIILARSKNVALKKAARRATC